MKIKKQVSLLFALLIFLAVFSISLYSGLSQRQSYIDNEIDNQIQVADMVENTLMGQYYAMIYNQVYQASNLREQLRRESEIFKNIFIHKHDMSESVFLLELKQTASNLSYLNTDFFYVRDSKIMLSPVNADLMHAKGKFNNVSLLKLIELKSVKYNYYLTLELDGRYYVCIINSTSESDYYALCKDVTDQVNASRLSLDEVHKVIHDIMPDKSMLSNSDVMLIDARTLNILESSQSKLKGTVFASDLKLDALKDNYSGTAFIDNTEVYTNIRYFPAFNWYILTYRNYDDIIKPAYKITAYMLLIGIVVLIISLIIALYFTSRIVRSLGFIAIKAREISKANLIDGDEIERITRDLHSDKSDEVGDLSRAFVTMAVSLKANVDKLIDEQAKSSRIEGELAGARTIQLGMLPSDDILPNTADLISAAYLIPAKEVGGDFFDAFALGDDKYIFTVGDVSDKGIPAALFMSMTMTTLRLSLRQGLPLEEVMYHINNTLAERNPNMMFVTLYVVKVDARTRHCEAVNAGHCFPIVYNNDTLYELDTVSGPAIGAIEDVHYEKYSFDLKSGDSFIIYSDGISEAQNSKAEFFSVEHILKTVREHEKLMPQDMLDAINKEIDSFRGTAYQSDDITALCFKLK